MDDLVNTASSSLIVQQLADLLVGPVPNIELLPTISQYRLLLLSCILYLVKSSPICTLLNRRLRFS